MARYKHYDYAQTKLLPVSCDRQILPGTFEYTLNYLIDEKLALAIFEARYKNDEGGAPAYDPAILLKIMLCAYSKGIIHSRKMAQLCRENVVCMALSADTTPHFTTIAAFVSLLSAESTTIFRTILLVCDEVGLIGREMFASDGVKLPSNASKEWSGTKADLQQKAQKMPAAVEPLLAKHGANAASDAAGSIGEAAERQMQILTAAITKIEGLLATHEDKLGTSGTPKQSHITDNESAKMPTSQGDIQGYDGVAIADSKHQVIVHAEAFGEGQEHGLLMPMLEGGRETFQARDLSEDILQETKRTADARRCPLRQAAEGAHVPTEGLSAGGSSCPRDLSGGSGHGHKRRPSRLGWTADAAISWYAGCLRGVCAARIMSALSGSHRSAPRGLCRGASRGQAGEGSRQDEAQDRQRRRAL